MGENPRRSIIRAADEALGPLRQPDIEKVWCRDCIWREQDRMNGDIEGATLGICQVYDLKPYDILWKNVQCPYYLSENDEEDDEEDE